VPRALNPEFLLWRTQSDQDKIGPYCGRSCHRPTARIRTVVGNARIIPAHDRDSHLFGQQVRHLLGDSRSASQQIDPPAPARRKLEKGPQKIGSGNPFGERTAEQTSDPHQRHSVGERKARIGVGTTKCLVLVSLHHVIHVGCEDRSALPTVNELLDFAERLSKREGVDPYWANAKSSTWARGPR